MIKRRAKLAFVGTSHAAQHLSAAAWEKGFELVSQDRADVIFISEDTLIARDGTRDQEPIRKLAEAVAATINWNRTTMVVTSQIEPGFMASLRMPLAYHQVELLRMRDAGERARHPEMLVIGAEPGSNRSASNEYEEYLRSFNCRVICMDWQEAEFTKIAINMALAAQVNYANRMKAACDKIGANWTAVADAVHLDSRIGPHAYLETGRWQDSLHLLRDWRTLERIMDEDT